MTPTFDSGIFKTLVTSNRWSCDLIDSFISSTEFDVNSSNNLQRLKNQTFGTKTYIDIVNTTPSINQNIPNDYIEENYKKTVSWTQCALYRINIATFIRFLVLENITDAAKFSFHHLSLENETHGHFLQSAFVDLRTRLLVTLVKEEIEKLSNIDWLGVGDELMDRTLPLDGTAFGMYPDEEQQQFIELVKKRREEIYRLRDFEELDSLVSVKRLVQTWKNAIIGAMISMPPSEMPSNFPPGESDQNDIHDEDYSGDIYSNAQNSQDFQEDHTSQMDLYDDNNDTDKTSMNLTHQIGDSIDDSTFLDGDEYHMANPTFDDYTSPGNGIGRTNGDQQGTFFDTEETAADLWETDIQSITTGDGIHNISINNNEEEYDQVIEPYELEESDSNEDYLHLNFGSQLEESDNDHSPNDFNGSISVTSQSQQPLENSDSGESSVVMTSTIRKRRVGLEHEESSPAPGIVQHNEISLAANQQIVHESEIIPITNKQRRTMPANFISNVQSPTTTASASDSPSTPISSSPSQTTDSRPGKRYFAKRSGPPPLNRPDSETASQSSQPMDGSAPGASSNSINDEHSKQRKRRINQVNNPTVINWDSDEETNNVDAATEINDRNRLVPKRPRWPIDPGPQRSSGLPQQHQPPLTHQQRQDQERQRRREEERRHRHEDDEQREQQQHTVRIESSSVSENRYSSSPPPALPSVPLRRGQAISRSRAHKAKRYNRWTSDEVAALREGLLHFKCRAWQNILDYNSDRFGVGRTSVDLRDKARNEIKQRKLRGEDLEEFRFAEYDGYTL